jgi:hypothetical protein
MNKLKEDKSKEEVDRAVTAEPVEKDEKKEASQSQQLQVRPKLVQSEASLHSKAMLSSQNINEESQGNLMTQSELFRSYAQGNLLYLNVTNNMYWFEFGGNKIGRLLVEATEAEDAAPKWRLVAKYKGEFPCHFATVYLNGGAYGHDPVTVEENRNIGSWFLIGGMGNNCLQF